MNFSVAGRLFIGIVIGALAIWLDAKIRHMTSWDFESIVVCRVIIWSFVLVIVLYSIHRSNKA